MKTTLPLHRVLRPLLLLGAAALATSPGSRAAEQESKPKLLSTTGGGAAWSTVAEVEAAIKKGNPKAKLQLGEMILSGDPAVGPKPDIARGLALLDEAARAGEANAAFRLGMTLYSGEGVEADPARGVAYLRAAAAGGHHEAFRNMGVAYSKGRGVKRDYAESLAWLTLAEKHGTADTVKEDLRKFLTKQRRTETIAAGEKRAAELERELAATTLVKALPAPAPFTVAANAQPVKSD